MQAPLQETIDDFWAMVWQEDVSLIVMLCPLAEDDVEKSSAYWPASPGQSMDMSFGKVSCTDVHPEADFKTTTLVVEGK